MTKPIPPERQRLAAIGNMPMVELRRHLPGVAAIVPIGLEGPNHPGIRG